MKLKTRMIVALAVLALTPLVAHARALDVDVWTDRGSDAVYQPGEKIVLKARATDDAWLLVYEIDAEGYVHVLWPDRSHGGHVEARRTYRVPPEQSDYDLVVQAPTGQSYIVAIAATDRFEDLPWYLRPYDPQAAAVGYVGNAEEEQGITAEGRVVGDPFVAMERIRRRVLRDPDDPESFGTSYISYYVHDRVRYPRYLCYDCHRPGYWAWWDGFDPYYTSCSVFDFRVNYRWYWGPSYWFGAVPYYCYVPRRDCPPRYRFNSAWYSSWDGWRVWSGLWGGTLRRYKSPAPIGYVPPSHYDARRLRSNPPPGLLTTDIRRGENGIRPGLPMGRMGRPREDVSGSGNPRPWVTHEPTLRPPRDEGGIRVVPRGRFERPAPESPGRDVGRGRFDPAPGEDGGADRPPRDVGRGGFERAPRDVERGGFERAPRDVERGGSDRAPREIERGGFERAPREVERPRNEGRGRQESAPEQRRYEPPRQERAPERGRSEPAREPRSNNEGHRREKP